MDIKLTPISFNDKKKYVASVYQAMTKLMAGQDITIKISHQIDLKDLVEALDNIEDIVHAAAKAMDDREAPEPEGTPDDEDPADWWKN